MSDLSLKQTETLDRIILSNRKILGIRYIMRCQGSTLPEALKALFARYRVLRESRNNEFAIDDEEYWNGFYS